MTKRLIALLCVLLCFFQCSCLSFAINTAEVEKQKQLIKQEFSEYSAQGDLAFVYARSSIHFATHEIDIGDIKGGSSSLTRIQGTPNGGFWFENGKIYCSTTRHDNTIDSSFLLYECDFSGNNLQLIYEKGGYRNQIWAKGIDGIFYISHGNTAFDSSNQKIDTYNLRTGEYIPTIASGNDCSLEDYFNQNRAWVTIYGKQNCFELLLPEETESVVIDKSFIDSSPYATLMNKYGYSHRKWGIVDGRVLLIYRLNKELGIGEFPYLVFEYRKENHSLVYQMLGFWNDDVMEEEYYFL